MHIQEEFYFFDSCAIILRRSPGQSPLILEAFSRPITNTTPYIRHPLWSFRGDHRRQFRQLRPRRGGHVLRG